MASNNGRFNLALVLIALMVFSTISSTMETVEPTDMTNQIEEIETIDEVTGRQVDADCTGYSFEDMFYYNYGEFIIEINPTWDGAFLRAKAMVNGTDAANMRDDLDGLFEGLAGGDNGWLSTDERDGVEAIGKDCVVQTYTRIGLRGGPSHRGGSGVNWNNATWIKDGMTLEETNLIPEGHPERRDCKDQFGAPSGSPTCEEIPTYPANVGQCGPNSCDTIIYLNASVAFNTITDPSNFTIGMVGRNLTNTQFTYIFPNQASPLRVANSYEDQDCTAAYTEDDDEADDYGVTYTTREECQTYTNEGDLDYTMTAVNDGTSFSRRFTYDGADWPATREYFIDFTTAPPEVDNPPEWSSDAPDEGELIPVAGLGDAEYIVELADVTSWFIDDLGAGMLDVDCTGAAGWNLQETASNHWMVTSPSGGTSATVECLATDSSGQSTSSRTFTVAPIFTIAVAELTVLDGFTFTITPSSNAPSSMNVVLTLMQNGLEVQSSTTVGSATDMTLSVASLSPGSVNLLVQADGDDMNHFEFMYELGITKQSLPPTIEITGFEWVDANYILRGLFSDPDGETVSFTLKIDGVQQGQVSVTGNQWQTDEIPFDLLLEGLHTIGVDACDASGECTSISEDVELVIDDPTDNLPDIISSSDDDSGLPAAGIGLTMMALIGAGFVASRRREE